MTYNEHRALFKLYKKMGRNPNLISDDFRNNYLMIFDESDGYDGTYISYFDGHTEDYIKVDDK